MGRERRRCDQCVVCALPRVPGRRGSRPEGAFGCANVGAVHAERAASSTTGHCGFSNASDPPWQNDKFGREMYPRVRREVHRNAAVLRSMGFVQSGGKPWLFRLQLPDSCGVVFANFGSTEEVPLWEDPSALIHWKLHKRSDEEEEALVKQLLRMCRSAGAKVRVSFYDQHFDQ